MLHGLFEKKKSLASENSLPSSVMNYMLFWLCNDSCACTFLFLFLL